MSGKKEKAIRKLAKLELEKRMQPQQRQINVIEELSTFVATFQTLTGEKPAEVTLTDAMYNLYVQTIQKNTEIFGLNPGFKTEDPTFMDMKILKKSPLIIPTQTPPIVT